MRSPKIDEGKLSSDALSALLFDSLAMPAGNRLTISGFSHINGIGGKDEKPVYDIHGTFPNHLSALPNLFRSETLPGEQRRHRVTRAVIASAGMAKLIEKVHTKGLSSHLFNPWRRQPVVSQDPIPLITIPDGTITALPNEPKDPARGVTLEEKFLPSLGDGIPPPRLLDRYSSMMDPDTHARKKSANRVAELAQHRDYIAAHINPLLMPDIKQAADAVRAAMNPEIVGPAR